jgi:predicted transposase YbfD/YdcC
MLQSFLFRLKDHRRAQGRRYLLGQILLFSILAILSGANSYRKIHLFIHAHYETLNRLFGLEWKQVPAHTTVREIIHHTSSTELEDCFRAYSADLVAQDTRTQCVSFDGKVVRGSFDHFRDQKAIQVFSAFLGDPRIILAHEEIAEKTNEIPTAQDLILKLGLSGYLFTFDALHCQTKTLETAKDTGNDVIVQVKENQKTLFNDCQTLAQTTSPQDQYQEPTTKAHGRIESRQVEVFLPTNLTHADKWARVEAIIKVDRHRLVFDTQMKVWQPCAETSFYISTMVLSAQAFCQSIRGHWQIENGDHHVRDVALAEDPARIRINPHIFAKLRSFALNILRVNHVDNVSQALFNNCMNLNNVLRYSGVM